MSFVPIALRDIAPEYTPWLWKDFLPVGVLALLDGDPGLGKSLIAIDLAARLSRCRPMPDQESGWTQPVNSVILSGDDNLMRSMRPRAEAAGADLERIFTFRTPLLLPQHCDSLCTLIDRHAIRLVVMDPLSDFLDPKVAMNVERSVRDALKPLAQLASRSKCTFLMIRHLTKSSTARSAYRGLGSMSIAGVTRAGVYVTRNPDEEWCTLSATKSNLGAMAAPLRYRVASSPDGQPCIEWLGPVERPAAAANPPPLQEVERAADWLRRYLEPGPKPTSEIYRAATEAQISQSTLYRARRHLGLESASHWHPERHARIWTWMLATPASQALTFERVGRHNSH